MGHFLWPGPARSGPSISHARPAQSLFYSARPGPPSQLTRPARPGPSWPDTVYKCLLNKNIHGIELNDHLYTLPEPGKE